MAADEFYCIKLLEATGLVVVPGSGFDQERRLRDARLAGSLLYPAAITLQHARGFRAGAGPVTLAGILRVRSTGTRARRGS